MIPPPNRKQKLNMLLSKSTLNVAKIAAKSNNHEAFKNVLIRRKDDRVETIATLDGYAIIKASEPYFKNEDHPSEVPESGDKLLIQSEVLEAAIKLIPPKSKTHNLPILNMAAIGTEKIVTSNLEQIFTVDNKQPKEPQTFDRVEEMMDGPAFKQTYLNININPAYLIEILKQFDSGDMVQIGIPFDTTTNTTKSASALKIAKVDNVGVYPDVQREAYLMPIKK